jgi:hypothetical protein
MSSSSFLVIVTLFITFYSIRSESSSSSSSSYWCTTEGCVSSTGCQCPSFISYCNTNTDVKGQCSMTAQGIIVIAIGAVLLFCVAPVCLTCCFCCMCSNGTCRRDATPAIHIHPSYIDNRLPLEIQQQHQHLQTIQTL